MALNQIKKIMPWGLITYQDSARREDQFKISLDCPVIPWKNIV